MLNGYLTVVVLGLCLAHRGGVCDDELDAASIDDDGNLEIGSSLIDGKDDPVAFEDGQRNSRFVIYSGNGVPEYDDVDDEPGVYDYNDYWYENDDDDGDYDHDHDHGYDGPDYHHVWWHHFYHHGEPHLPFPLFPPIYVHRRPVHKNCDQWPFVCRSTYEAIRWLQCYREFLDGSHGQDHGYGYNAVRTWKK